MFLPEMLSWSRCADYYFFFFDDREVINTKVMGGDCQMLIYGRSQIWFLCFVDIFNFLKIPDSCHVEVPIRAPLMICSYYYFVVSSGPSSAPHLIITLSSRPSILDHTSHRPRS